MKVAMVTANLGGIDPIHPTPQKPEGLRMFYFTDRSVYEVLASGSTWDAFISMPWPIFPRTAAKWYKCQAHKLEVVRGSDRIAWADSAMRFSDLSVMMLDPGPSKAWFIPHPDRSTIGEEYEYVLRRVREGNPYLASRYAIGPLEAERDFFGAKYDLRQPLYCGGLWSLPNNETAARFLDLWWAYVQRFSILDQASLTIAALEAGLEIEPLELNIYRSDFFERVHHA